MVRRLFTLLISLAILVEGQDRILRLSLKRAVELAISPEGNTRMQLSGELTRQAESRRKQALAALLPNVDATVSHQSATRNLEALGVSFQAPGFAIPTFVGPFNIFDVRAAGTQTLLDLSATRRYQAARQGVGTARAEVDATADQVASQVAKAYLAALRSEADLEAVQANVTLAEAVLRQAENLKSAGTGTGIDVTRARVQLLNERQRQLTVENERKRVRLQLLRAMNVRLDTEVDLADRLEYQAADPVSMETAKERAYAARPDYRAQQERLESTRLSSSAVRMERVPSLGFFADYGSIGSGADNALPTRAFGVQLRVPIFDGGRRDARRAESASQLRSERLKAADLRDQIDLEIRLSLDSLHSAEEEVKVAQEGLSLADSELHQARRRFDAGVTNSLEVTGAQSRLARARDNRIWALYHHAQARIDLAQATGTLRSMFR